MPTILMDTGVWYAVCDERDTAVARSTVTELYRRIEPHDIVFPWPIAYETLRTKLAKKPVAMARFEQELKSPRIKFIHDDSYREDAMRHSFDSSIRRKRPLSMIDCLLRLILEDPNMRITYFVTFNLKDFSDVCCKRRIESWP